MNILKFGGSSVKDHLRIKELGTLMLKRIESNEKLIVVVSALGGATDSLISMARLAEDGDEEYLGRLDEFRIRHQETLADLIAEDTRSRPSLELDILLNELDDILRGIYLIREASLRTMDITQSFGERLSAFIIARYFSVLGITSAFKDARRFIVTDERFGQAQVNMESTKEKVEKEFPEGIQIPVVTGFIGASPSGHTTTLGRGGSDYTAAILASCTQASALEIWTDVDGFLTADPRAVDHAYSIPELSYEEALELSHFGAKVIYPPTIQPALKSQIPIFIKNSFNPDAIGSRISEGVPLRKGSGMTGLTSIQNVTLLTISGSGLVGIPGTAARFFQCLGLHDVNIIMITQASSEHSICVAVMDDQALIACEAVNNEFIKEQERGQVDDVKLEKDHCVIAMVGEGMRKRPGVAGRLFSALGRNGINVSAVAQGSSELNVTFVIGADDRKKSLNLLHDTFFEAQTIKLHVYLLGVGLIGSTLIEQIIEQHKYLSNHNKLDIRIVGLANSKKMLFNRDGIKLENWKNQLDSLGEDSTLKSFSEQMVKFNLVNSVLVDCTANPLTRDIYPELLSKSMSISTANKVAASSSQEDYDELLDLAHKHNSFFMNETNVGAGLPVLATIKNMVQSGDKITELKAVISGSLSYIFNQFNGERSFAELVKEAREKGFTEPDPREDLSGNDIKRKIIILARTAGYKLEPEDVEVEPLLPEHCMNAPDVGAFFEALESEAAYFKSLIQRCLDNNSRLRYIASLKDGKAKVSLEEVQEDKPFFNLASTDNMVVIHSDRYSTRPLTVSGPGAGAGVTAAGVFAELISLGHLNNA